MRGGLERWKRGTDSQGVRQAMAYAFQGSCDSHLRTTSGAEALASYSNAGEATLTRYVAEQGEIRTDELDAGQLRAWVDGRDPVTTERRGRDLMTPQADLILDGTINAPKSYSIAALIHPELAAEFEALHDRLRERVIRIWQREVNARRGAGGRIRERVRRVEVVELKHRRSRALDPHIHRHLWLNVKVQGMDGQWSNIDSRVAMKLHTVINAEGELAARTDPRWVAALAGHGYTLDEAGEIRELAQVVRPLSRRSNQIEANRALLVARWRLEHPGQEPSPDVVHQIDRRAWATHRPDKPQALDEEEWEARIRSELTAIDPSVLTHRPAVHAHLAARRPVDRDLLAAKAITDADIRATSSGGRFSAYDIRGGVIRAIAASGVVADRCDLDALIDNVIRRAEQLTIDLLTDAEPRPAHIKGFMALSTAAVKVDLAARFDTLNAPGEAASDQFINDVGAEVLSADVTLDASQRAAAAAIAGTDRLVSVTGPAGAGKTTLLRVVRSALSRQGRRLVVVAPTKKAAVVAGREVGAAASSLHALLADHGWRWTRDDAGAETWTQLRPGDTDPATGWMFTGPRNFPLQRGDRVVVDEAGMVDLHTANALAQIAEATGAGIAMIGDHLQAMPVGHSGAMACMTRRASAVVELTSVHRFHDPAYAALTLRMREPATRDDAFTVATELDARGQICHVADDFAARQAMVDGYFRWSTGGRRVALVTSTNEEADAINDAIQQRRTETGDLTLHAVAVGQGEQRVLEGDTVQTRRNDTTAGVENRALWVVRRIDRYGLELAALSDPVDTRRVTHDYAAEHIHLAYASTVHGIQGETTDASIVGPGVDAAGLYVGMTRGRTHNEAITIAHTAAKARENIADTMMRGTLEVTIDDARAAACTELGRAAHDPHVAELAHLLDELDTAIDARTRWLADAHIANLSHSAELAAHAAHAHHSARPIDPDREEDLWKALNERMQTRAEELRDLQADHIRLSRDAEPHTATPPATAQAATDVQAAPTVSYGRSL